MTVLPLLRYRSAVSLSICVKAWLSEEMAKKGGAQQLQAEINTSDELRKFLDRDGLLGK